MNVRDQHRLKLLLTLLATLLLGLLWSSVSREYAGRTSRATAAMSGSGFARDNAQWFAAGTGQPQRSHDFMNNQGHETGK
jgi:hypothetical protein